METESEQKSPGVPDQDGVRSRAEPPSTTNAPGESLWIRPRSPRNLSLGNTTMRPEIGRPTRYS